MFFYKPCLAILDRVTFFALSSTTIGTITYNGARVRK